MTYLKFASYMFYFYFAFSYNDIYYIKLNFSFRRVFIETPLKSTFVKRDLCLSMASYSLDYFFLPLIFFTINTKKLSLATNARIATFYKFPINM